MHSASLRFGRGPRPRHPIALVFFTAAAIAAFANGPGTSAAAAQELDAWRPDAQLDVQHVLRNAKSSSELDALLHKSPERCANVNSVSQICSWRLPRPTLPKRPLKDANRETGDPIYDALAAALGTAGDLFIVCVLPRDEGQRSPGTCSGHRLRTEELLSKLPRKALNKRRTVGQVGEAQTETRLRASYRERATTRIGMLPTAKAISRFVGEAPMRCANFEEGTIRCTWIAAPTAPGWADVVWGTGLGEPQLTDGPEPRPKVTIDCVLPTEVAPRAPKSCQATLGRKPGFFFAF